MQYGTPQVGSFIAGTDDVDWFLASLLLTTLILCFAATLWYSYSVYIPGGANNGVRAQRWVLETVERVLIMVDGGFWAWVLSYQGTNWWVSVAFGIAAPPPISVTNGACVTHSSLPHLPSFATDH